MPFKTTNTSPLLHRIAERFLGTRKRQRKDLWQWLGMFSSELNI